MKNSLLILTVCAFAAAMVPLERCCGPGVECILLDKTADIQTTPRIVFRAMNPEETLVQPSSSTTTEKPKEICAPQTPCAWSPYKKVVKIIEINITNTYCVCSPDTECQLNEDDTAVNVFIYRCRAPVADEGEEEGGDSES